MKPGSGARHIGTWSAVAATATAALTGLTIVSVGGSDSKPGGGDAAVPPTPQGKRPNIVLIVTDDQDVASLSAMPNVRRLLAEQGTTYSNSFVSTPLCAPSRASLLTGQYAHNHRVTDNGEDGGGYEGLPRNETLPVWLSRSGYATAHVGKFLNGYGVERPREVPPGWGEWYGLVGPSTYTMYGYTLNENGTLRTYGSMHKQQARFYQTDVLANKVVDYINRRAGRSGPFFLSWTPLAPHNELPAVSGGTKWTAPRPAPRHRKALSQAKLPRPKSFNEADVRDKPRRVRQLKKFSGKQIKRLASDHRQRLRSLLAVDEAVGRIVSSLRRNGMLDNTLILFTSDNGMLEGQHRINYKEFPYEESIRVPLIARGPGVPARRTDPRPVTTVDLTATVLSYARAKPGLAIDGKPFLGTTAPRSRDILIETGPRSDGPWYTAIRTDRYLYVEHSTGERELYDLRADPFQLTSRAGEPALWGVRADLIRRLHMLRSCAGRSCP